MRSMARSRARRRQDSAARRTLGSLAHRYAVLLGTWWSRAHNAMDLRCAIAKASLVFISFRSFLVMARIARDDGIPPTARPVGPNSRFSARGPGWPAPARGA